MVVRKASRPGSADLPGRLPKSTAALPPPAPSGTIVHFHAQDGLTLAGRIFDAAPAHRLPLLCLPGLSRNSRDFLRLAQHVSADPLTPRRAIALDYRGRGLSDADPDWRNYTPLIEAQDVLTAATVFGVEKAVVVGTSRGGIIAMLIGALRPGLIAGVVLNDIGPVIEGTGLARIKRYLSTQPVLRDWPSAISWLRNVAAGPFPILEDADWQAQAEAIFAETPRGIVPQFDPNLLKTVRQIDFSDRIPVLWPQFDSLAGVPMLAIRGENSDILSPRTFAAMAERRPGLEQLTARGQGHAPLLRDRITLDRISAFATRCDVQGSKAR